MFLLPNNSDNYDNTQEVATKVAILKAKLNMMRLDHPDRPSLLTEFTTLQAQLTLKQGVQQFGTLGFTF